MKIWRFKVAFAVFGFHMFTFPLLLYQEHIIASWGLEAYSWTVNTWSKVQNSHARRLFNLPEKYRRADRNVTIILGWKPPFEFIPSSEAIDDDCILTFDQSAVDVSDAIVFHFRETSDSRSSFPTQNRDPSQVWIWYSQEPPSHTLHQFKKILTPLNGLFNWTMSYRFDSDVLSAYKLPNSMFKQERKDLKEIMERKTASAVGLALISNCASSLRSKILTELSSIIDIDVFGKCSKKILCREQKCQKNTMSRYKFFFAFENSLCQNYISEKLWSKGFLSNAVPVVMGAPKKNYELIAPNHSFIHVDDFSSTNKLAQYLHKLDQNDELYLEYFKWRLDPEKEDRLYRQRVMKEEKEKTRALRESILYNANPYAVICRKLKNKNYQKNQVVKTLDKWWYGDLFTPSNNRISMCAQQDENSNNVQKWIAKVYAIFFCVSFLLLMCYENKHHHLISYLCKRKPSKR